MKQMKLVIEERGIAVMNDLTMMSLMVMVFAIFWGFTIFCEKA